MNELFGAYDQGNYQRALEGYTNAVTVEQTDQGKLNRDADEYNEELTGITDPIGMLVGGKGVEGLVQKGLKKVLGKSVTEKIGELRQRAVNERGISDLQELRDRVAPNDLAGRTQQPRPSVRGEGDSPQPDPTTASEAGQPVERPPADSDTLDSLEVESEADQRAAIDAATKGEFPEPPAADLGRNVDSIASDAGEAAARDGTDSLGQDLADQGGRQIAKAIGKGFGRTAAEVAATTAEEAGTDAALEGAGVAADAAAGAEGGLNPVADVIAGAVGLATLLGGIFGEKKAKVAATPDFIPSAQFGI